MKLIKILTSLLFIFVLAACGRVQPILNIENTPVAYDLQKKEVKAAIIESATNRGWIINSSNANELVLEMSVRTHTAVVRVPYSQKFYSILYVSSENLKSDGKGNIHRNYNRWVNNLKVDIQKRLAHSSATK